MDLRRLRPADWLTGLAGVALFLLLFAPWYGVSDGNLSGWQAFAVTDVVFAITAVLAVGVVVVTATRAAPALPIAADVVCAAASVVSLVLVLVRLANVPHDEIVTGRSWGVFAGTAAVVAVFVGAWWAMRDERAPGMRPAPEPELLPAPPAAATGPEPTAGRT
jgi:hypothetical protein